MDCTHMIHQETFSQWFDWINCKPSGNNRARRGSFSVFVYERKVLSRATMPQGHRATGPVHVLDRRWFFWDNRPLLSPSHKLTAVAWTEFPSKQDVAQICIITRATSAAPRDKTRWGKALTLNKIIIKKKKVELKFVGIVILQANSGRKL